MASNIYVHARCPTKAWIRHHQRGKVYTARSLHSSSPLPSAFNAESTCTQPITIQRTFGTICTTPAMPVDGTPYQDTADVLSNYCFGRLGLIAGCFNINNLSILINSDVGLLVTPLQGSAHNLCKRHSLYHLVSCLVP